MALLLFDLARVKGTDVNLLTYSAALDACRYGLRTRCVNHVDRPFF